MNSRGTAGRSLALLALVLAGTFMVLVPAGRSHAAPAPASGAGPQVLEQSLSPADLRPGTRGTAYTVFQGDQPVPFGVEILGVLPGSRPKGDLILFKALGDSLEHVGIVAGMSGSPVYVDGKIIGAIAFAFPFAKDAVGMITPIGEMREGMARTNEPTAPWMGVPADVYEPMLKSFETKSVDADAWSRLVPEAPQESGTGTRLISLCAGGWAPGMEGALDSFSRTTGLPMVPAAGGAQGAIGAVPAGSGGSMTGVASAVATGETGMPAGTADSTRPPAIWVQCP